MDQFTTILTLGVTVVLCIVAFFILTQADGLPFLSVIIPLLMVALLLGCYAGSIKAVIVTDGTIIVERKIGERVYPMNEITAVQHVTDELDLSLRLFGNGGLFGYMGWFRSGAIGTYQANANRRDARILLTFKDGKQLVLSADQSVELSADIAQRLAAYQN